MSQRSGLLMLSLLLALLSACGVGGRGPSPTPSASPSHTGEPATPAPQPCTLEAGRDVTVFSRPDRDAPAFGTLAAGTHVIAEGRTVDGWFAFEPAVAQAANVGVFRLRWIHEQEQGLRAVGPCDDLLILEGPPAGVCFTMPMGETPVYEEPRETAPVIASLVLGHYAAVVERTEGWAKVDLSVGNTGIDETGWVTEDTLNLNGPCPPP